MAHESELLGWLVNSKTEVDETGVNATELNSTMSELSSRLLNWKRLSRY